MLELLKSSGDSLHVRTRLTRTMKLDFMNTVKEIWLGLYIVLKYQLFFPISTCKEPI